MRPSIKPPPQQFLKSRGSRDRVYKNTLTFLAADSNRLSDLEQAARMYLAWRSIEQDGENGLLNLDNFQRSQTRTKCAEAEVTLEIQVRVPGGVGEPTARTVLENARTLKFSAAGFEEE